MDPLLGRMLDLAGVGVVLWLSVRSPSGGGRGEADLEGVQAYVAQLWAYVSGLFERANGTDRALGELDARLARIEQAVERIAARTGCELGPPVAPPSEPTPQVAEAGPAISPPRDEARPTPLRPAEPWVLEPEPELAPPAPDARPAAPPEEQAEGGRRAQTLEALIGEKWTLWLGITAVVIAGASGLAVSWASIPEWGRALLGAVAGAAFLATGHALRGRTSKPVAEGVSACGVVLLYLSVWAAATRYQLFGLQTGMIGMSLITALCVGLALLYDAPSLMVIAMTGGYLTPAVLRSAEGASGNPHYLLGYLAVLTAGVLAASLVKRWRAVHGVALAVMCVWMLVWMPSVWERAHGQEWIVFGYLTAYFLLFVGVASAYSFWLRRPTSAEDIVLLATVASAYLAGGLYALPAGGEWARGIFGAALAVWWALVALAAARRLPDDRALRVTCVALALCLLAIAFPLLFHGDALVVAWSLETVALAVVGWATGLRGVSNAGVAVYALAIAAMVIADTSGSGGYEAWVANPPWPTFLVLVGAGFASTVLARAFSRRHGEALELENAMASLTAVLTLGVALREARAGCEVYDWFQADHGLGATLLLYALTGLYGTGCVFLGFATRIVGLRWLGGVGTGVGAVGVLALASASGGADWMPFLNIRAVSVGLMSAACAAVGREWACRAGELTPGEAGFLRPGAAGAVGGFMVLWLLTQEVYRVFEVTRFPSAEAWGYAAQLGVSLVWTLYAAAMMVAGIARRRLRFRITALVVFALALLKVFLFDLRFLTGQYRTFSFGALGLVLICVAVLYGRYRDVILEKGE